jgi:hypothetical protein
LIFGRRVAYGEYKKEKSMKKIVIMSLAFSLMLSAPAFADEMVSSVTVQGSGRVTVTHLSGFKKVQKNLRASGYKGKIVKK